MAAAAAASHLILQSILQEWKLIDNGMDSGIGLLSLMQILN